MDDVERFFDKDFVFHDAEVDSVSINRDGTVKVTLWTWSDVDHDKYVYADFTLSGCMDVSALNYDPSVCYVYELRYEVSELRPDIITVIFDGVGLEFSYRKIDIKVSECQD